MHYSLFIGGFESALFGDYTGVIAVSLQGAADPFAASPPAANQVYPAGLLSGGAGCKHQAWTFDSDRNEMIFGGGDTFTNSRPDFYAYNPATRQQTKIINAEDLGAEAYDRSIEYISISNGGSGYPPGGSMYYPNYTGLPAIPLIGGTGYGAACALHSSGGVIDSCTMHYSGYGYTVGDVLTVSNSYTGGTGSGFQLTVTGVTAAGTPSTIISPDGRCLPGIRYDKTRHVMWLEGGGPRRTWASNLKKGGLWALDRNATPPTWYLQGPSVSECGLIANMLYNEYSTGLFYDEVGQALYTTYLGKIFKYSLAGVTIDGVYRNNWSVFNLPSNLGVYNSYPAFDTLRRRIVIISTADSATYVWNCATDTLEKLTPAFVPVWDNWWHASYDTETDRVICWTAASYTGWGEPGFVANDYIGKRIHWMYSMAPDGTWTQFTPAGDKLIQDNVHIAEMSGGYDPYHKCLVILAGNQCYENFDIGDNTVPPRMTIYHLMSPTATNWPAWRTGLTDSVWSTNLATNTYVSTIERNQSQGDFGTYYQQPGSSTVPGVDSTNPWAYSSGVYVPTHREYAFTGGGHNDWLGSEVGEFNLDTLTWVRTDESAKLAYNSADPSVPFQSDDNMLWRAWRNPSGRFAPIASHTYGGLTYLPSLDKIHVFGSAAYRGGNGNPGGATFIDATTGHWDETGAMAMESAVNCQSHTIPVVHVVNSSMVPTGATITDGIFRVQIGNASQYWMLDPVGKTKVPHTQYWGVTHASTCSGCIVPDHLHPGRLAFVTDQGNSTFFYAGYADYVRNDGGYMGNGESFSYGNTKPAAIGSGHASTWIYMGDHIPGSTKIAVYKDGVGLYALDAVTWEWSALLVAAPVAASTDACLWNRFFYASDLECFGLFSSYGAEFRAITVPNELK